MAENFTDLVTYLSSKLDADYLMIAAVDDPLSPVTANTLFVYSNGEYLDNFQYDLKNTPCENVVDSGSCVYPENVQNQFPDDALLADMDIIAYGGAPLHDKEGKVNGVLAALYKGAIRYPESVKDTLDTFSHWASAEVNRVEAERGLQESEEMFRTAFELNPDAVTITRVDDGNVVNVNDAFVKYSGHTKEEVIGTSMLDIHIWPAPEVRAEFLSLVREKGSIYNSEFPLIRKDGTQFDALMSSKTISITGEPHLLTIVRDVTELQQAHEEVRKSLVEKEVLLREIHHRVKNNMQVVSSLLNLQARQVDDEFVHEMFEKSQSRIRSMSLVHEQLYQSEDFAHIGFQDYLEKLVNNVADAFVGDARQIAVTVNAQDLDLSIDSSMPCGLIVTELVSNAYKYAFPSGRHGTISIKADKDDDDMINLRIEDDGTG
ncbi:PAS domain S-box protein, partial [bacterium]|nr:PAS domain S-box protein [bacterium]